MADETANFVIGGRTFSVPPLTFLTLERAWPAIRLLSGKRLDETASANPADPIARVGAVLEIVVAGLSQQSPAPGLFELKSLLRFPEHTALFPAVIELFRISGMEPAEPGEAMAAGSTAISAGSSPNSQSEASAEAISDASSAPTA